MPDAMGWGGGLFLLAWLGGWTVGGLFAAYTVGWMLLGREVITIDDETLLIERRVPLWNKIREYGLEHVKNLRRLPANPFHQYNSNMMIGGELLGFDYGSATIRFGQGLEEVEADQVLKEIAGRFEDLVAERPSAK